MTPTPLRPLSLLEARVAAVLVEKQASVPDSYPLTLNALVAGCNQKTARDPVIAATDSDVLQAVDALKSLNLVIEVSGSRVSRYEHNVRRVLGVPSQSQALLAILMLRGPQTAAELRSGSERLHRFADISSVEAFLDELAAREPPLVARLARSAGAREQRWAHLLSGEPPSAAARSAGAADGGGGSDDPIAAGEIAALKAGQRRMADEIAVLRGQLARLAAELGVTLDD